MSTFNKPGTLQSAGLTAGKRTSPLLSGHLHSRKGQDITDSEGGKTENDECYMENENELM